MWPYMRSIDEFCIDPLKNLIVYCWEGTLEKQIFQKTSWTFEISIFFRVISTDKPLDSEQNGTLFDFP